MRCILAAALLLAATACGSEDVTAPDAGILEIITHTSGDQPGTGGYSVQVDDGLARPIGANETLRFNLSAGTHAAILTGLATNCATAGDNPRAVQLEAGETTTLTFAVTCSSTTASIAITVRTSGAAPDPDGYVVTTDTQMSGSIGINGSLTFTPLSPGMHGVRLSGLADNCYADGGESRQLALSAGKTSVLDWVVHCPAYGPIAFTSNGPGGLDIFIVNPDRGGFRRLSSTTSGSSPLWSPDGRRVLFRSNRFGLYVIDQDGSHERLLAGGILDSYRWSPDGSSVAYAYQRQVDNEYRYELWVQAMDGSGVRPVAIGAIQPSWAPEGRSLAYVGFSAAGKSQVRIVNLDGSGDRILTGGFRATNPVWSPDGARIAFLVNHDIWVINPDGTDPVNLTLARGWDQEVAWSPDGSRLVFTTSPLRHSELADIGMMNRDGSGRTLLTHGSGISYSPHWSPDGARIVFTRFDGTDTDVFVVDLDGSRLTDISNRRGSAEYEADWAPGLGF